MPVQPVTPMPNLFEYQPNDFYDLRPGPSEPYDTTRVHSEWFDASPSTKKRLSEFMDQTQFHHTRDRSFYKFFMLPGMSFGPKWQKVINVKLRVAKKHKPLYIPQGDVKASINDVLAEDADLRRPTRGIKKNNAK